jgi:hypothetical protein
MMRGAGECQYLLRPSPAHAAGCQVEFEFAAGLSSTACPTPPTTRGHLSSPSRAAFGPTRTPAPSSSCSLLRAWRGMHESATTRRSASATFLSSSSTQGPSSTTSELSLSLLDLRVVLLWRGAARRSSCCSQLEKYFLLFFGPSISFCGCQSTACCVLKSRYTGETAVRSSGLPYTVIRPVGLTNETEGGPFQLEFSQGEGAGAGGWVGGGSLGDVSVG